MTHRTWTWLLAGPGQVGCSAAWPHAGAIDHDADSLLLDETATQPRLLGRAARIAHETVHMWILDLVTMWWHNDVWMKEVFASFMAAKIVNLSFLEIMSPPSADPTAHVTTNVVTNARTSARR